MGRTVEPFGHNSIQTKTHCSCTSTRHDRKSSKVHSKKRINFGAEFIAISVGARHKGRPRWKPNYNNGFRGLDFKDNFIKRWLV